LRSGEAPPGVTRALVPMFLEYGPESLDVVIR